MVPLKAAYRHSNAVAQLATLQCSAKCSLLMGVAMLTLGMVSYRSPSAAFWLSLAVASACLPVSYWLFNRAAKLRGYGVGTLRVSFEEIDAMREAGVPAEWIKKLEQGDVLLWSEDEHAAHATAIAAVSAAMQRK
jgi:hypothetical protein